MSNKDGADICKQRRKNIVKASCDNTNSRSHSHATGPTFLPVTSTHSAKQNDYYTKVHRRFKQAQTKEVSSVNRESITKLSNDLCKMINNFPGKEKSSKDSGKIKMVELSKKAPPNDKSQQMKKIIAECLQKYDDSSSSSQEQPKVIRNNKSMPFSLRSDKDQTQKQDGKSGGDCKVPKFNSLMCDSDSLKSPTLLRSYLSESIPRMEEYVSKKRNVSNSLISSDSIHHSIYLESGREKRQCLLQYLTNVATHGQVVIYANSIPAVQSLLHFLIKHGFQANAVHPQMLMAEFNWILSEFSLKSFKVLLCAEDHYHSCPAHFRSVKFIFNYDLPIYNPVENWVIRNGIVDFSDNLPVHIYTFIKKACPLDTGLVKLLQLDSGDEQKEEKLIAELNERSMSYVH